MGDEYEPTRFSLEREERGYNDYLIYRLAFCGFALFYSKRSGDLSILSRTLQKGTDENRNN